MFSEKLKEARKNKKLTLEELAELYNEKFNGNLSKGTLSKYENRKQEPMISTVSNLATILGVTTDYLLDKEKSTQDELNEYLEYLRTRPEMKMLFSLTKDATKEDVEKAVKIIETMLGK